MARRAVMAVKMRARTVKTRNRVEVVLFVFVITYLLSCGDIEANPGPPKRITEPRLSNRQHEKERNEEALLKGGRLSDCNPSDIEHRDIGQDLGAQILEAMRQQKEAIQQQTRQFDSLQSSMKTVLDDIGSIKTEIGHVRSKCEDIKRRCDSLEKANEGLQSTVTSSLKDIGTLANTQEENKRTLQNVSSQINGLQEEIESLQTEVDKHEQFSRRDNLRVYGIPHVGDSDRESYDTCARAVTDILNSVDGPKQWTTDDIARAHRVGRSQEGKPRPMIVKFSNWKDKMSILSDRQYRDSLESRGVKVSNDLTRKQAAIVAEARREGKVAFFRHGKMTIGPRRPDPRRPDPRTYAEVAASEVDSVPAPVQAHRGDGPSPRGQGHQEGGSSSGDSPSGNIRQGNLRSPRASSDSSCGQRDTNARAVHDSARRGTKQKQSEMHEYLRKQRRSPPSPHSLNSPNNVTPNRERYSKT
jgi:archaellum component FlaC